MDLFEMRNGRAFPSLHALMIEPFKSMWEDDDSDGKGECVKDFTYIELLCSPKRSNVFNRYEVGIREEKVRLEVYGNGNAYIHDRVMLALMKYKEFLADDFNYQMLDSAINTAHKTRLYLEGINLMERTPNGAMVIKPKEVLLALKEIPGTLKSLEEAKAKALTSIAEAGKTRNDREPGRYEE